MGVPHLIRSNWRKNHRHHGGVRAVTRCLLGTVAVRIGLGGASDPSAEIEVLTFSVVPWMTVLWHRLLAEAIASWDTETLIGDCSGGFGERHRRRFAPDRARVRVVPLLNDHHGAKLDLFLARLCRSPYVLISDDDVFWLDGEPLSWALAQLDLDPRVAAVSLLPRADVSSVLRRDGITQPMGSHCLVIRRDVWLREKLSFAVAPPPGNEDWFYDTGDLANRELLRRGYRVAIADEAIVRRLVAFDGVSTWVLKIQGHSPAGLAAAVADVPIRQRKALQTITFLRGLAALIAELGGVAGAPEIIPEARLAAAERALEALLPAAARAAVRSEVEANLARLRGRFAELRDG